MADYHRKIVNIHQLRQVLREVRESAKSEGGGATVVQCHGCFDIVHPGHIRYLEFARSQGDVLVVSITGDAAIDKGVERPYIPQDLRAENLAALEFVDYVVIDRHATACTVLQAIRPDLYVKGHEYATSKDPRFLAERSVVESNGGRVIFSSGQVVFSSSRLVETMPKTDDPAAQRLRLLCRRQGIAGGVLSGVLDEMAGKRVLVLGDVVIERYVLCDASSIASESPMMSLTELDQRDHLGGAATIARQLAALSAEPVLVTNVGRDRQSEWAMRKLTDAGISVRAVRQRRELPMKTRFLVDDHKLFKVDRTAVSPLDSVGERTAADILLGQALRADAAIICDCGYGMITPGLLQRLGATFRHRVPMIAGGAAEPRGHLSALRYFDLLCCSERMLRTAMNDFGGGLSALAYQMMQRTETKQMILTLGKRGLVTFDRPSHDRLSSAWHGRLCSEHLPSLAERVVDQLGCDESVLAVSALALSSGADLMQAAYLGAAAAAIQVAELGLVPSTTASIQRWVARRPESADGGDDDTPTPEPCVAAARSAHAFDPA